VAIVKAAFGDQLSIMMIEDDHIPPDEDRMSGNAPNGDRAVRP